MNWGQFKDPVYHMSLAGTVIASWSLTLEDTGSNSFNDMYFESLNSVKTFRENSII